MSSVLLAGAVLATSAVGHAQCTIDVVGPESAVWLAAADALGSEFTAHAGVTACTAVRVEAADGQAKLTFTANDGRTAERLIEDPVELVPTVQALSIEVPPLAASHPEATRVASVSAPVPRDRPEPTSEAATERPYELHPVYGAQVGFRAGADHLISPCLGVFGAVKIDRWELGILGRFEAHYVSTLGGNEGAPETSTLAFGVAAGRRAPLGAVELRGGLTGLLASLHEDNGNKRGQAEARLGIYGGGVLPLSRRIGLRADLTWEVVPYSIGRSQENANGTSSLPWWGVTSGIGVEVN